MREPEEGPARLCGPPAGASTPRRTSARWRPCCGRRGCRSSTCGPRPTAARPTCAVPTWGKRWARRRSTSCARTRGRTTWPWWSATGSAPPPFLRALLAERSGYRLAPAADPIGEALGARLSLIVRGERPGLLTPESLGLYLTYAPRVGRLDAERNCISNVHAGGLDAAVAARAARQLVHASLSRPLSGVHLRAREALPEGSGGGEAESSRPPDPSEPSP